ncbi:MAG: hypothetical protein DSO08_01710 [Candidatus Methanomethylicota archaeon]|jgi:hypothetical protein|uniref:Uncharacterized protein n=1 Tax=Thermoproteota archaeon TaxID=2056631 RepID=A0A523BF90_9CREN|nr:MAG: hypothetical protein DSO08_01710 [Candidatus Verstraetearchaeota archaeon]
MPSRIIVYKSLLVGWLLLSTSLGYAMVKKVDWFYQSLKGEGGGVLENVLKGGLRGVSVDLEGFSHWARSVEGRQRHS